MNEMNAGIAPPLLLSRGELWPRSRDDAAGRRHPGGGFAAVQGAFNWVIDFSRASRMPVFGRPVDGDQLIDSDRLAAVTVR
jgi:hypothetical protein